MKISLCISVPNGGADFLTLAARSAYALASGEHEIEFHCTCHDESQVKEIESAISNQQSAISNQQSAISNQQSELMWFPAKKTHINTQHL